MKKEVCTNSSRHLIQQFPGRDFTNLSSFSNHSRSNMPGFVENNIPRPGRLCLSAPNAKSVPSDGASLFEPVITATKGICLFATGHIPRGTRILSEEPLCWAPGEAVETDLANALSALTPAQHVLLQTLLTSSPDCPTRQKPVFVCASRNATSAARCSKRRTRTS